MPGLLLTCRALGTAGMGAGGEEFTGDGAGIPRDRAGLCGAAWFLPRIYCFRIKKSRDSSVQERGRTGFPLPRGPGKETGLVSG